ncbi:hypothetical protein LSTR_LSTR008159 [Laodelphax striatellus]|uniref:Uncharacterized protein n=1 Tax=Laodelphax striatellus TaxID=195883 RepID=A0A482WYZ1_LAOST|nr:hypothetical protein LSTR_LSTR008159 [Laodelphax striatellus]
MFDEPVCHECDYHNGMFPGALHPDITAVGSLSRQSPPVSVRPQTRVAGWVHPHLSLNASQRANCTHYRLDEQCRVSVTRVIRVVYPCRASDHNNIPISIQNPEVGYNKIGRCIFLNNG